MGPSFIISGITCGLTGGGRGRGGVCVSGFVTPPSRRGEACARLSLFPCAAIAGIVSLFRSGRAICVRASTKPLTATRRGRGGTSRRRPPQSMPANLPPLTRRAAVSVATTTFICGSLTKMTTRSRIAA